jgi:hypothetical protein
MTQDMANQTLYAPFAADQTIQTPMKPLPPTPQVLPKAI